MTDPKDGQRPPLPGRRAEPTSADVERARASVLRTSQTEDTAPEAGPAVRPARLAADLFLEEDLGGTDPAVIVPPRAAEAQVIAPRAPRGQPLPNLPIPPVPSPLAHAPILPPVLHPVAAGTAPRTDSGRAIADSPEERERFEQPTQPIDITGYQELPLPSFATVEPVVRAHSDAPRLPIRAAPISPRASVIAPPAAFPVEPPLPPPSPAPRAPSATVQTLEPRFPSALAQAAGPAPRSRASSAVVAIPVQSAAQSSPPPVAREPRGSQGPSASESPPPAAVLARSGGLAEPRLPAPPNVAGASGSGSTKPAAPPLPERAAAERHAAERAAPERPHAAERAAPERPGLERATPERPHAAERATPERPHAAERAAPPRPVELPPIVRPAIDVALPASVLVVDDDRRAAAELASRLLELGYTCRVVPKADARAALEGERWDAVIVEIPAEEARTDQGRSRVDALGEYDGPIILTSAAVLRLEVLRAHPQVAGLLTKPYFMEVLVQLLETARRSPAASRAEAEAADDRAAAERGPLADRPPRGAERRAAVRHELDVNVVRALITGAPDGQAARGRVRNLSTTGGMLVETTTRLGPKAPVSAEITLYDGRMMIFSGRTVRVGKQELALKLDTDDTQSAFLEVFIREARSPDQRALQPVRITAREEGSTDVLDEVALTKRWLEVSGRIEDDEAQQRFIQDCLRAGRLELAVARYRELKKERPDDERVSKYLNQIGTILSFYALSKKDAPQDVAPKMPSSVKIAVGLFLLAAVVLLLILRHLTHSPG